MLYIKMYAVLCKWKYLVTDSIMRYTNVNILLFLGIILKWESNAQMVRAVIRKWKETKQYLIVLSNSLLFLCLEIQDQFFFLYFKISHPLKIDCICYINIDLKNGSKCPPTNDCSTFVKRIHFNSCQTNYIFRKVKSFSRVCTYHLSKPGGRWGICIWGNEWKHKKHQNLFVDKA